MEKTQRGEAMSVDDRLPPEIWYQILTKLPAKSILRCRSVCRTWYSLISSPHFITDHSAQTLNHSTTNRVLVHHCDFNIFLYKFSSHDESFVESHEHDDLTEQFSRGRVEIVGSCNGLVCLLKVDKHTLAGADYIEVHHLLIWNPSIRKLVQLPYRFSSHEGDDDDDMIYLLGFGFDSDSGDYKVLRFGYFISTGPPYRVPVVFVSEIFDLRKGVWRGISPPTTPRYPQDLDSCVYLHGALHWIGYEDQPNYAIVSFSLSSEVYQELGMPGDGEFKDVQRSDLYSVLVNNGLLSVAVLRKQLQGDVDQVCCSVWSMKEYGVTGSWTKLFNIELPYALNDLRLLRFGENGVVFVRVLRVDGSDLVVYNPENRTSKALFSVSAHEFIFDVCFYKESLVLP